MLAFRTIALTLLGLLLAPALARAQLPDPPAEPSREDVLQARDAFVQGMEFAGERRFEEARREFVHSYALSGSPVALFNLASTLRSLERYREAGEAFERLLGNRELESSVRSQAEPMYAEVARRVARLRLRGELDGATLRVDRGPARPLAGSSETVVVDPGAHDLTAERAGDEPWRWTGTVEAGSALDLRVRLQPAEAGGGEAPTGGGDELVLAGVGASIGVALVIVGVILGVVLDADAQLDPRTTLVLELP